MTDKPILYLGDLSLATAAGYLAGLMTMWDIGYDYVPSDVTVNGEASRAAQALRPQRLPRQAHARARCRNTIIEQRRRRRRADHDRRLGIVPRLRRRLGHTRHRPDPSGRDRSYRRPHQLRPARAGALHCSRTTPIVRRPAVGRAPADDRRVQPFTPKPARKSCSTCSVSKRHRSNGDDRFPPAWMWTRCSSSADTAAAASRASRPTSRRTGSAASSTGARARASSPKRRAAGRSKSARTTPSSSTTCSPGAADSTKTPPPPLQQAAGRDAVTRNVPRDSRAHLAVSLARHVVEWRGIAALEASGSTVLAVTSRSISLARE